MDRLINRLIDGLMDFLHQAINSRYSHNVRRIFRLNAVILYVST